MRGGAPNTMRSGTKFDVETLRSGIQARDASVILGFFAQNARLTIVDRREKPSHPFQISGKAAIGDFIEELCDQDLAHTVEQIVVSADGNRVAYIERCRYPDDSIMTSTSMLILSDGRIVSQTCLQAWDEPVCSGPTTTEAQAAAEHVEHLDFTRPDEVHDFSHGRAEILNLCGGAVGRFTLQPLWRWSEHVRPIAGTERCEATHFMYHLSGFLRFRAADGTVFDAKAGDVSMVPPGHDTWVVGNEPVVVVDWQGAAHYGGKKEQKSA